MKESLIELCNRVINNYKKSKEEFRYDGEYKSFCIINLWK